MTARHTSQEGEREKNKIRIKREKSELKTSSHKIEVLVQAVKPPKMAGED